MNRLALFGLLIIFAIALPVTPTEAATKKVEEKVESADPVKAATVNLYCNFRSGNKRFSSTGTGVFVSERGVILTNAHVAQYFLLPEVEGKVRGSCNVRTGSPAKNKYEAKLLYISPAWLTRSATSTSGTGEHDFALLYITSGQNNSPFPALPLELGALPLPASEVRVTGYPTTKLNFSSIRSRLKVAHATSTVLDFRNFASRGALADTMTLDSSPINAPGVSGGPVTNAAGKVVGVATAISSAKEPTLRAITLPYINRTLQAETGLPLLYYLMSDFAAQGARVEATTASSTVAAIKDSLFEKKR